MRGLLCLAIFLIAGTQAYARSDQSGSQLIVYLTQEKERLIVAINEAKQEVTPASHKQYQQLLKQNDALLALNKARVANFNSFMVNQNKLQDDFSQRLKQLQQFPAADAVPMSTQQKIDKINTLNDINKKTIALINENKQLAAHYQELLVMQHEALELWKSRQHLHEQMADLHQQEDKLTANLSKLYEKSLFFQKNINEKKGFSNAYDWETRLLLNNQLINLTQHKMAELNLQRKLAKADFLLLKSPDIRTLQTVTDIYKNVIEQLSDLEQSLRAMNAMLKAERPHVTNPYLLRQFAALSHIINGRIQSIVILEQTLQEDLENHQAELKKQLSVRQSLAEYHFDSWPVIAALWFKIPGQLYDYVKSLVIKVRDNYLWLDSIPAFLLWISLSLVLLASYYLNVLLKKLARDKARSRLAGHLYAGLLTLLSRNRLFLTVTPAVIVVFYFCRVPFANYQLLFNLTALWLVARVLIQIASLVLLERISDDSGSDVRLYYRLKWLVLTGGWVTALMMLGHLLPLTALLQDLFNRLFMLFLLGMAIVAWKSRDAITHLLNPVMQSKKRYLRNAVMLLVVLVPLTLLTTAVLGLIGYINLAWKMSSYQMQLLLLLSAYVLARGLLFDAMELLSEWTIACMKNGWLWTEVWLKPLDKILRMALVIAAVYIMCQLVGWTADSLVMTTLVQLSVYPLINMSGIHVTALSILKFLLLLAVFMWAAKWTREFSYRKLYCNSRDPGVRNSLSIFTQYAVILVGGFVTLRALGLDFSGMSMVIGGLAVGMGFGLRDFASNVVGGLMLLIERPVRVGDVITLGEFEGEVAHIGIRSMRVSSWDNMEVLIPNAETFNKPFTNWTHQDSIVRTVLPIKVSRADDPVLIQQLITDVLESMPEVVAEPPLQVFLKQIDDALVEFEVRYYMNVHTHNRFEIRSKVLFAIMAAFKEAGVQAPIPPVRVELNKEHEHDTIVMRKLSAQ